MSNAGSNQSGPRQTSSSLSNASPRQNNGQSNLLQPVTDATTRPTTPTSFRSAGQTSNKKSELGIGDVLLPQSGYRELATEMGGSHSNITLFRKFGDLNMLNLLSLQAELMHLRLKLKNTCEVEESDSFKLDNNDLPGIFAFSILHWGLTESGEEVITDQGNVLLKIRAKLKEYSKLCGRDSSNIATLA
jgi:hypothetical protein